jgi:hypothetical protein
MTDYMFAVELKRLVDNDMYVIDETDLEFLIDQASYMSNIERVYFLEVIKRMVGIVQ